MSSSIERRVATGILAESSPQRSASKGLAVVGVGGIALTIIAGLIPFVGVLGLSITALVLAVILFLTS